MIPTIRTTHLRSRLTEIMILACLASCGALAQAGTLDSQVRVFDQESPFGVCQADAPFEATDPALLARVLGNPSPAQPDLKAIMTPPELVLETSHLPPANSKTMQTQRQAAEQLAAWDQLSHSDDEIDQQARHQYKAQLLEAGATIEPDDPARKR